MSSGFQRRRQLAEFLKARRRQLTPEELGLPPVGKRASGLRREEVAVISGVSVSWYTWLEQGRNVTPSREVLDALGRALRLSVAEQIYLRSLAGYSSSRPVEDSVSLAGLADVQGLLDALGDFPSYAVGPDWHVLCWNKPFSALYPNVSMVPEVDRNLLWLLFTDPYVREMWPDWEIAAQRCLGEFRAEVGPRLHEPAISRLVEQLLVASETFRVGWENHAVRGFTSRERTFRHPLVGDLQLLQHRLVLSDHPDLRIVLFKPVPATEAAARLRQIIEAQGGH
jgi:transcriptional regulator with XRE-family HTH domain